MIHSVKGLAEIYKACNQCSLIIPISIQFLMDEIQHLNQVVAGRATWEATELVNINMWADEGPDPLNEKPLQALAKEGSEAKVPKVIFRFRTRHFINRYVKFLFIRAWPRVS